MSPEGDQSPQEDQRAGQRTALWPDLAPWRSSRAFRLLFTSRTVTALGTQASEVALLMQAEQVLVADRVTQPLLMSER
jgi:hypothetical protein